MASVRALGKLSAAELKTKSCASSRSPFGSGLAPANSTSDPIRNVSASSCRSSRRGPSPTIRSRNSSPRGTSRAHARSSVAWSFSGTSRPTLTTRIAVRPPLQRERVPASSTPFSITSTREPGTRCRIIAASGSELHRITSVTRASHRSTCRRNPGRRSSVPRSDAMTTGRPWPLAPASRTARRPYALAVGSNVCTTSGASLRMTATTAERRPHSKLWRRDSSSTWAPLLRNRSAHAPPADSARTTGAKLRWSSPSRRRRSCRSDPPIDRWGVTKRILVRRLIEHSPSGPRSPSHSRSRTRRSSRGAASRRTP